MKIDKVIHDMKKCYQIKGKQTVWEHGESVRDNLMRIYEYCIEGKELPSDWIIPCWLKENRSLFARNLYPKDLLATYALFHDCGKPYCETYDENG